MGELEGDRRHQGEGDLIVWVGSGDVQNRFSRSWL